MFLPKVEAFFREFPFLGRYIEREKVQSVSVQRIDSELLMKRGQSFAWIEYHYRPDFNDIFILDAHGEKLAQVGRTRAWNRLHLFISKETVGDAFAKLDKQGSLANAFFVLVYQAGNIVLFKPPKGGSVRQWYELESEREAEAFRSV